MRSSSVLATLLILVLLSVGTAHAVNVCSVGASHASHCGHSTAPPACCRNAENAPLASRPESIVDREGDGSVVAVLPIGGAEIVTMAARSRTDPSRFDHYSSLRLHLVLATLIV